MGHRFDVKHAARLLSEDRARLLPAQMVLDKLGVVEGEAFVDIGVGPGYFALPAAKRGTTVYGVDVEPKMLEMLQERAQAEGFSNIHSVLSEAQAVQMESDVADKALYAFVLHEVPSIPQALKEVHRVMKSGGQVMVLEWRPIDTEFGPPLHERLQEADVQVNLQEAGFKVQEVWYPNPQHYAVLAEK